MSAPNGGEKNQLRFSAIRDSEHPERRLTLILISTAIVLGFVGSTIGAFTLGHLSGVPTNFSIGLFPSHPYLQIYGFVGEFVMGVAYSLLPRFKIGHVERLSLGYLTYALFTSANIVFILSPIIALDSYGLELIASIFFVIGSSFFVYHVISLASRRGGGFPEANSLMMASSISLLLISLVLLLKLASLVNVGEIFSPELVLLALLGFAGSMIYAVEIRSVSLRQSDYRRKLAKLAWILQSIAVGSAFLAIISGLRVLSYIGGLFFLATALDVIFAIKAFEFSHPMMYRPAMTKMHFAIVRYNEVCIISGSVWLVAGCILGLLSFNLDTFFVKDSFIHSIAIGFVGSTITCFAPMLLPSVLGKKAPVTGLSFWPISLLNAGMVLRLLGNTQSIYSTSPPIWESLSGPLVLAAMISFVVMLPRIGRKKSGLQLKVEEMKPTPVKVSNLDIAKDQRDGNLILKGRRTNREISVTVWHAENRGSIYLLPLRGTSSNWYNSVLANSDIKLVIAGRTFSGKAMKIVQKDEVHKVIKLFKDKYGDRVYNNFFGTNPDCALALVPDTVTPSPQ